MTQAPVTPMHTPPTLSPHPPSYALLPHTPTEDQQFNDEKAYLIKQIKEMQPTAVSEGATP